MTESVKNFIEVNYPLLDEDMVEFFHIAYNGLTIWQQKELVRALTDAGIDTLDARETFIRFHIMMSLETIERRMTLRTVIARFFDGILGFDADWLFNYILDNIAEWEDSVTIYLDQNKNYVVVPKDLE